MAIALRNEGSKINSNINVTPMVDVMLVLLIIFMVITPMLQPGVPVDLAGTIEPDRHVRCEQAGRVNTLCDARWADVLGQRESDGRRFDTQGSRYDGYSRQQDCLRPCRRAREIWNSSECSR